ncbi:endonuclease/exonuclease/phosphatase family protein [Microbispora sp. NPDC049125]|uniref:endonuclease/exonuclease/phosphatase family protein n=1 Tax=Microbispora sp. NPDC049125 TaxID=3154929 RepID=UPI0034651990
MSRGILMGTALAAVIVGPAGLAWAAGPESYRVSVLTYNVCGSNNRANTCAADLTPERRRTWARQVAGLIRSRDVDVASFTEMCYAQVSLLKPELPGYRIVWYGIAGKPGAGDACRRIWGDLTTDTTPPDGMTFGMALALKEGTDAPPLRRRLRVDHAPADADATIHPRGLLCATGMAGPRRSVCCVTHLSDTETPAQVAGLVARYADGRPVILTGDFNRLPGHGQLSSLYGMGVGSGSYTEADAAPCGVPRRGGDPTTRGGRKIDYIFATEADYQAAGAEAIQTRPELSDHLALAGTLIATAPWPRNDAAPWRGSCRESGRRRPGRRR